MTNRSETNRPTDRAPDAHDEPSFVRRWLRRKHQAQTQSQSQARESSQEQASTPPAEAREPEAPHDAPPESRPEPTDADMPPIESLGEGSDYRGFLSPQVSESLRRAALRKLFQSPRYNFRDGLDDYDGDYTRYTALEDDSVTAHAKFHTERLRRRLAADADAQPDGVTPTDETPPADPAQAGEHEEDDSSGAPGAEPSDASEAGDDSRENRH